MLTLHHPHRWDVTPAEAIAIQQRLRDLVISHAVLPEAITTVAGVDVGFEDQGRTTRAAVVILEVPGLQQIDHAIARLPTAFPYVPGLLSFREIPAVLAALGALPCLPDLILCDGQGLAHPRRCGIACHLGVLTDIPTIGVGKTRLIGSFQEPPQEKGAWTALEQHGETLGAVLRTRVGVQPVFISVGHRIDLVGAVEWVMRCTTRYRLPETTRYAHRLASPQPNVPCAL